MRARGHLHIAAAADDPFPEIDGRSPEIRALKEHMLRVSRDAHITVLIVGESGTGKERVARAIHRASPRARAPFIVVNCAGLTPTLVEDELFGHVRGAFTGAVDSRPGPFERAGGGTVFLDEVGELAPDLQVKLLRALQQRSVQRLGGTQETSFDVRIVAATNVDLKRAAAAGRFREDLYYRLKVYEVSVPSLRHRGAADIRALSESIVAGLAQRRRRPPPLLDPELVDRLVRYNWPGNVRELENTLECAIVAAAGDTRLMPNHLPDTFGTPQTAPRRRSSLPAADEIAAALERNGFRSGRTAAELGLSRHQLYRLLKRYGVRLAGPQA